MRIPPSTDLIADDELCAKTSRSDLNADLTGVSGKDVQRQSFTVKRVAKLLSCVDYYGSNAVERRGCLNGNRTQNGCLSNPGGRIEKNAAQALSPFQLFQDRFYRNAMTVWNTDDKTCDIADSNDLDRKSVV